MKLVDANVLVYAVDATSPHHAAAKRWLDGALSGSETVLLPWLSLLAFVRLTTHPSLSEQPLTVAQAFDIVEAWLASPVALVPGAGADLAPSVRDLLAATGGRGGNLANDAFLAALALKHKAQVVTFDNDFERFDGLSRHRPAAAPE
ncbi:MAG: PIN domain-containing protein [Bifidobacteriaceae bacterium]|jgi:toxin-antitoxin system PIN domain toxin|nr:PIN domain-containing protein [Bifidobacteriaceae bacterium]